LLIPETPLYRPTLRGKRDAEEALVAGASVDERSFYAGKLAACRYFFSYELPKVHPAFALVRSLDDACLSFEPSWF
jgi:butyryl-CoA dehydrogenase